MARVFFAGEVVSVLAVRSFNAIQFLENTTGNPDYGRITTLPDGFGDGEFTLKVVVKPNNSYSFGTTDTPTEILQNWSNEDVTRYSTASWWWDGNFLLDGHNNNAFYDGTFSIQIISGRVRWTFGDGSAANALTGDVWGIQDTSAGKNIVDNAYHVIHLVRRWSGVSDADLEVWVDGVLEDTQTTTSRTDMASTYWDSWTGFPAGETGWLFGAEKEMALSSGNDVEDYKGQLNQVAFYNAALSQAQIEADQGSAKTGYTGYADHFDFSEGSGATTTSKNGIAMSLVNSPSSFWP